MSISLGLLREHNIYREEGEGIPKCSVVLYGLSLLIVHLRVLIGIISDWEGRVENLSDLLNLSALLQDLSIDEFGVMSSEGELTHCSLVGI